MRPVQRHLLIFLAWALGLMAVLVLPTDLAVTPLGWVLGWLLSINLVTFLAYGYDKAAAKRGTGRIAELALYGLIALGGSGGAFGGMLYFRHKTIKGTFLVVFWTIILLQAILLAWCVWKVASYLMSPSS